MVSTLPVLSNIVTDVTLREGSQQSCDLRGAPIALKTSLLGELTAAGSRRIELTAFAPGEWFSDAEALVTAALARHPGLDFRVLYFNARGAEALRRHPQLRQEGIFHTAVTENYRRENYRQVNLDDLRSKLARMLDAFRANALSFDTLVLSTCWGESGSPVSAGEAVTFAGTVLECAAREGADPPRITLADTVGNAAPEEIGLHFDAFRRAWPEKVMCAHLHPPLSAAESCVEAAIDAGAREWEAAWGGVGGSPFADRPGGNLDLRILIRVWRRRGAEHGYDTSKIDGLITALRGAIAREIAEVPL